MARCYLYMKRNRQTGVLEYDPSLEIKHNKLPTCPCGNAMPRKKCKRTRGRGMCVWCGGFQSSRDWEKQSERLVRPTVIKAESLTALQRQIEEKGLPPPIIKGANKYWGYVDVAEEPRLLNEDLREKYERRRRKRKSPSGKRRTLNLDDRDGFLEGFKWPWRLSPPETHRRSRLSYIENPCFECEGWRFGYEDWEWITGEDGLIRLDKKEDVFFW